MKNVMNLRKILWASCFRHEYVLSIGTRSLMLPQGSKLFLPFRKPNNLMWVFWNDWSGSLLFVSHIGTTLFSIPPRLVGWIKLCKCGGPISSWLMFFSFFRRMWMASWKGKFGWPEMVLLCCEKRFKAITVVWWLIRVRYLTRQEICG